MTGFKSFAESAEVEIDSGLTGIVGPNGCGKSNIVEGLRWVMGESNARQMRGSEMDDVIFSGTDKRPARNLAEITLHLDNSDRTAPSEFNGEDEIEITRKIERGKGSNYYVNARPARAKDVQLLFADSATGARSSGIVSQGRIGAIIGARPVDRRALLEEAANIRGLHARRHEAELRLRAAETNLERLDDVIAGLVEQRDSLRKQARQASRYRSVADRIRKAEAQLLLARWTKAESSLAESDDALRAARSLAAERTEAAAACDDGDGAEASPTDSAEPTCLSRSARALFIFRPGPNSRLTPHASASSLIDCNPRKKTFCCFLFVAPRPRSGALIMTISSSGMSTAIGRSPLYAYATMSSGQSAMSGGYLSKCPYG